MSNEYYRVKCANCMACEEHFSSDDRAPHYWCDFWCTTVDDAQTAFCSYFTPHAPKEEDENGRVPA